MKSVDRNGCVHDVIRIQDNDRFERLPPRDNGKRSRQRPSERWRYGVYESKKVAHGDELSYLTIYHKECNAEMTWYG